MFDVKPIIGLLIGLFCLSTANAVEIYKWVGPDGTVTFSERPPPSKAERNSMEVLTFKDPPLIEAREEDEAGASEDAVDTDMGRLPPIKIYTTTRCPYCRSAKAHMDKLGISYTEYNLDLNPSYKDEFQRAGGRGVPLILMGTYRMNGFSPDAFDSLVQQALR